MNIGGVEVSSAIQLNNQLEPRLTDKVFAFRLDGEGNPQAGFYDSIQALVDALAEEATTARDVAVDAKGEAETARDAAVNAKDLAEGYRDDALAVSSVGNHVTDAMPHRCLDENGENPCKYGFRITSTGRVQFCCEEVV